ncbi:hypothetical protein D3C85_1647540 [compost metagenome]
MFANTCREHQHVQTTQCRDKGTGFVDEAAQVQRKGHGRARLRGFDFEQFARVAGNAGNSQQTRLVIQNMADPLEAQLPDFHQENHRARVQRPAAGTHHQTVQR